MAASLPPFEGVAACACEVLREAGVDPAPLIALAHVGDGPAPIDYAKRIRSPLTELRKAAVASTKNLAPLLRDTLIKALGGKSG